MTDTGTLKTDRSFSLFFYGWHVGVLSQNTKSFFFEYNPNWKISLSPELPLGEVFTAEHPPCFFENLLAEGWTEALIHSFAGIAKDDFMGNLLTAKKYHSNLSICETKSGAPIEATHLPSKWDSISNSAVAKHFSRESKTVSRLPADLDELYSAFLGKELVRFSGVQAKLPVAFSTKKNQTTASLGTTDSECSHILKFQSKQYPHIVENEWSCMELARLCKLNVASIRMVDFRKNGLIPGLALLIERFDIVNKEKLEEVGCDTRLYLQQDASSLLQLCRHEKYNTSAEIIAQTLVDFGVPDIEMRHFLDHLLFSYLIGNGDLHAKNISILLRIMPGKLGQFPVLEELIYSPIYDLVNTRLLLPDDRFAFRINEKKTDLTMEDFFEVAAICGKPSHYVKKTAQKFASCLRKETKEVLQKSKMPAKLSREFISIVEANCETLGV